MADHQFQPSSSWWTSATAVPCRPDVVSLPATPPLVNCSAVLGRSLNYCDSSVTFQDHPSAPAIHAPPMDHFHGPHDWSQVRMRSENSFHGLLQEDAMNMEMMNPLDISSIDQSSFALLDGLNLQQLDGGSQSSLDGGTRQQLQFSGEALFWSPIPTATEHHNLRPPPQPQPQPQPPLHHSSSSYSNNLLETPSTLGTKASMEKRKNTSEPAPKRTRIDTSSPLPLPTTFKVRKEKLGDRITALQQLVSPFGKTDTASVLHEAIDYIDFLHDQVRVLSAPYLKNNGPSVQQLMNLEKSKGCDVQNQDLRSRGLCLVPISTTFAVVANEIPTDLWTPSFIGGAFR